METEFFNILHSDLMTKLKMIVASSPSDLEVLIAFSQVVKQWSLLAKPLQVTSLMPLTWFDHECLAQGE